VVFIVDWSKLLNIHSTK